MRKYKKVIVLILIVAGVVFLFNLFKKDQYIGFYYPDAGNLINDIQSPTTFDSIDVCRNWIYSVANDRKDGNYDYECGKNCKLQNGQKPYICEETLEQFSNS